MYNNNVNFDSGDSIFFARELENMKQRSFEVAKAPLASTRLIPVDATTPSGFKTVTYTVYDNVGRAKIISNFADDFPAVNISGQQYTSNIKYIGEAFHISIQDLQAAKNTNKPLEQRHYNAALRVSLEKMNNLAFFGDAAAGIVGWLGNTNVNSAAVAGANPGAKLWSAKTPDLILTDLNTTIAYISSSTNGVEYPNTVVMPITQYQLISSTRMASGTDTTILQFFLQNNPGITVEFANELKGAFPGGTDGFIMYDKSVDKFWQEIPTAFFTLPPQWRNATYIVNCMAEHGGTIIVKPGSQAFRYGI